MAAEKRCPKCGKTKRLGDFRMNPKTQDGINYWCRDCCTANDEAYFAFCNTRAKEMAEELAAQAAASGERRHARLAGVISEDFDITDLFERDGEECRYCGATENLAIEHVIPISEGGPNILDNCVVACRSCNSSKGAKPFLEWLTTENKLDVLSQGALL